MRRLTHICFKWRARLKSACDQDSRVLASAFNRQGKTRHLWWCLSGWCALCAHDGEGYVSPCVYTERPEEEFKCPFLSLSSSYSFQRGLSLSMESTIFSWASGNEPSKPPYLYPTRCWGYRLPQTHLAFYVGTGGPRLGPHVLVTLTLYPLSCLSKPHSCVWKILCSSWWPQMHSSLPTKLQTQGDFLKRCGLWADGTDNATFDGLEKAQPRGAPPSVGGAFPYTVLLSETSQCVLLPPCRCSEQDQKADGKSNCQTPLSKASCLSPPCASITDMYHHARHALPLTKRRKKNVRCMCPQAL